MSHRTDCGWRPNRWDKRVKHYWQRAKRGYSIWDLWNLNTYLAKLLANSLEDLANTTHGYAPEFETIEEWRQALREMSQGFRAFNEEDVSPLSNLDFDTLFSSIGNQKLQENYSVLRERFDKGMSLFHKYFNHLWD